MKHVIWLALVTLLGADRAVAQSNIDNTVPNKFAWQENIGWTNWRDANAAAQGVVVGGRVFAGFIWAENVGWIKVGDGTPTSGLFYANADGTDFGVNIGVDGMLHGYGWGENVGWINFDGGAMATPAQPARITCDGKLHGYAWSENVGWLNLDDATHFVELEAAAVPIACDMNHDGSVNGNDIQVFVNLLLAAPGPTWRDTCSGDLNLSGTLTSADVAAFAACLLS